MNITWYGQNCFYITSQRAKDDYAKVIINPLEDKSGLKMPKLEADILLSSSSDVDKSNIKGDPFFITGLGEYEIKGVFIQGINYPSSEQGKNIIIYTIETEDLKICYLGNLNRGELENGIIEKIGEVDILMIPVGGGDVISGQEASKIIKQIEPHLVIPMRYHIPKLKEKLDGVDKFLKIMGQKPVETQNKLSIKKKGLPKNGPEIIILNP